jgi:hypothetical protein
MSWLIAAAGAVPTTSGSGSTDNTPSFDTKAWQRALAAAAKEASTPGFRDGCDVVTYGTDHGAATEVAAVGSSQGPAAQIFLDRYTNTVDVTFLNPKTSTTTDSITNATYQETITEDPNGNPIATRSAGAQINPPGLGFGNTIVTNPNAEFDIFNKQRCRARRPDV